MPTYQYQCECEALYEVHQGFSEATLTFCPACETDGLRRVLFPPTIFDATPRTIGSLADRNAGPGRQYWVDKQRHDLANSRRRGLEEINAGLPAGMTSARLDDKPESQWFQSGNKPKELGKLTDEQKLNYVYTGDISKPAAPVIQSLSADAAP